MSLQNSGELLRMGARRLILIGVVLLCTGFVTMTVIIPWSAVQKLLAISPQDRDIYDWVTIFRSQDGNLEQFNGQPADVTGFVIRDANYTAASEFTLGRLTPPGGTFFGDTAGAFFGLPVQVQDAASFAQDSWVRVKGTFQLQTLHGLKTPVLVAETVESITQPTQPYLIK